MAWNRIQLCILIVAVCLGIAKAQQCLSVNDVLPQLPTDLQEILKQRMDVFSFKGTVFLPTSEAWKNRDLKGKYYSNRILGAILDIGIIPGVRFAERPSAGRPNGTVQLESKFKDNQDLFCLTGDDPDNKVDVDIRVTGTPDPTDTSRFSVQPIPGNTYKAGNGTITIVKVYSDIKTQNLTATTNSVSYLDAIRDGDDDEVEKYLGNKLNGTLRNMSSWIPANVVRVVQCQNADVFFTDHMILPCPMCGEKCGALVVSRLVMIILPVTTVFAAVLAVAGYVAICCGGHLCSKASGVCGCFWKVVCNSLVFVVVVLELLVVAAFIGYAHYFYKFGRENDQLADTGKWRPYLIWSVVGAVLTSLIVVSLVWSIFSASRKRRRQRKHQQFYSTAPPPMYNPVGTVGPMTA